MVFNFQPSTAASGASEMYIQCDYQAKWLPEGRNLFIGIGNKVNSKAHIGVKSFA